MERTVTFDYHIDMDKSSHFPSSLFLYVEQPKVTIC